MNDKVGGTAKTDESAVPKWERDRPRLVLLSGVLETIDERLMQCGVSRRASWSHGFDGAGGNPAHR
jgi:hypothetical protein